MDIPEPIESNTSTRTFIGLIWSIISIVEIFINSMVLYSIIVGKLWKGRGSPIYIIAASNLAVDIVQLAIHTVYLTPSITAGNLLFNEDRHGPVNVFFSSVFMFCWYHTSLNQTLTALNRVTVICFSCRSFNTTRVFALALAVYPIAFCLTLCAQFFFPCCKFSFDPFYYSYSYTVVDGVSNWSNMMDIPLNNTSSFICIVSYAWIFLNMRRSRRNLSTAMAPSVSLRRKYKEYRYAMQFCAISVFYLLAWVCFRIFPHIVPSGRKELFSFVSLCVIINSGANGFTYLYNNKEVKRELRNTFNWILADTSTYQFQNESNSEIVRKQTLATVRAKSYGNSMNEGEESRRMHL